MSYIIGISGCSGSGKTSFIHDLKKNFSDEELCVISQDDYYLPKEQQTRDENGIINFDLPGSIDIESFALDINRLSVGETVEREEYTFNNKMAPKRTKVFKPAPIIVAEGLFLFHHPPLLDSMDLTILINARISSSIIRRIKRDNTERNYPLDDVLYRYEHHVIPSYEKHILPSKDNVDLVINNNKSYDKALEIMVGYLKDKLKG